MSTKPVLGMFDVKARSQKVTESQSYIGHVTHAFWLISAIEFNSGVVYAVRDHFQHVK